MKKITFFMSLFLLISWQGIAQSFNAGSCPTGIAIPDNNLTGISDTIIVSGAGTSLGVDIILEQVNLHITHTWGSDLDVYLTSPNGVTVELTTDNGGSGRQYGNDCIDYTSFNMSAATAITTGTANFVGLFIPEGTFVDFNDASSANGEWYISVYDDAGGDIGNLEFVELVFATPPTCPDPTSLSVSNITPTSADLSWMQSGTVSAWDIEWDTTGFTPTGTPTITGTTTNPHNLTGLSANTFYDFYVKADCNSSWVGPFTFFTGYCIPSSSSASTYVDNFTTSNGSTNISNLASGFTTGGYFDGSGQVVESYETGSFDFNAEIVGGTAGFSIWVDWNNDLIFDNLTEKVYNTTTYTNGPFAGTITVPASTPLGNYRMRITTDWNQTNPSLPCGAQSRAEFEDYTVTVVIPPSCLPPSALTAINIDGISADLGWTESGSATNWDIEWDTTGFTPGTGNIITGTSSNPYNLTGLTSETSYEFYVRADCGGANGTSTWVGPFMFTTLCLPTPVSIFPWTENFDGETTPDMPCGWIVDNVNADAYSWETNSNISVSPSNSMSIRWNSAAAMDDWAFTPQLNLTGGQPYQLSFEFAVQSASFPEKLMVMYGNGQNSGAMSTILFDSTFNNTVFETATAIFTPATTGSYFIGFHGYSNADMFRMFVDDVTVDMTTEVNTNNKDVFAIYPNPTTGILTLKGNTTNSNVNVTNIHGQSVYRNTVIGNQLTIDLSKEAKGLYIVSISTEKGTETYKVVIQ